MEPTVVIKIKVFAESTVESIPDKTAAAADAKSECYSPSLSTWSELGGETVHRLLTVEVPMQT